MRILNYISVVYISRRCCSCRLAFVLAGGISVGVGIGVLQPATTQISFIKFVVLIQQREREEEGEESGKANRVKGIQLITLEKTPCNKFNFCVQLAPSKLICK